MRLIYFAELFDCPLDVIHVKSDADKYFNAENNFFKKNKANITYSNIHYIQLEKGDVIVFPAFLMHRVKPITRGQRKCLVFWTGGRPLR
jgi:PKHD-type hydroxylase